MWLRYCTWCISTGIYSYVSCCLVEDDCEPNCDGSCIIALFINREEGRRHQESLTKDWHEKLITMTTKHSFVRGKKEYTVTASEIRHAVLQQRQHVSISIIRTQCQMTVLHYAVIEGRVDVIRVGKMACLVLMIHICNKLIVNRNFVIVKCQPHLQDRYVKNP